MEYKVIALAVNHGKRIFRSGDVVDAASMPPARIAELLKKGFLATIPDANSADAEAASKAALAAEKAAKAAEAAAKKAAEKAAKEAEKAEKAAAAAAEKQKKADGDSGEGDNGSSGTGDPDPSKIGPPAGGLDPSSVNIQ